MHIRRSGLIILMLYFFCNSYGQNKYSIDLGAHFLVSSFDINTKSTYYNSNWKEIKLTFNPKKGYGFSLGITKNLSQKFKLNLNVRYQNWGGIIYAIQDDPKYFLNLDLNYKSINIPLSIQFVTVNRNKLKIITSFGLGMDFSHSVIFKPTNYYGTIPSIERKIDVVSPFLNLGILIEYIPKEENKLSYIWGISFSDDHFFNSKRFNDFGGYFRQDRIPLNSTILNTFVALKFNL